MQVVLSALITSVIIAVAFEHFRCISLS